jgi:hypothetical protein
MGLRDRAPAPSFIRTCCRLTGHTTRHTHESETQRERKENEWRTEGKEEMSTLEKKDEAKERKREEILVS